MQQFEPFKIVHVEGRNNLCADSLSRLHLYNLMSRATDNLNDEEVRMAEEGEGGDDDLLMNSTCTYRELRRRGDSALILSCRGQALGRSGVSCGLAACSLQ